MSGESAEQKNESSRLARASASSTLEHAVVETEDGDRECTLFPRECEDEMIVTHWLTATGDAFVALDTAR